MFDFTNMSNAGLNCQTATQKLIQCNEI